MTKKAVKLYIYGDLPDASIKYMRMFKDENMKYVSCLVKRFLELSSDFSSEDINRVSVSQGIRGVEDPQYFIHLKEDIDILDLKNDINIKFQ